MRIFQQPNMATVSLLFLLSCAGGVFAADTASLAGTPDRAALRVSINDPKKMIPAYTRELLTERLAWLAGQSVQLADGPAGENDFLSLALSEQLSTPLGSEGYRITLAPGHVYIEAAGGNGVLYGVCRFLEWAIGVSTPGLADPSNVDIDFPTSKGQAAQALASLPRLTLQEKPFYPLRFAQMQILALGVADLLDAPLPVERYYKYSGVVGGFKESARLWKRWCDWLARHRMNAISNWPYTAGTNWWELDITPESGGMSPYSPADITAAIARRRELLAYARSRGLAPYLMNYIPGAITETIKKNHPEVVGTKFLSAFPEAYAISSPATLQMFTSQIAAIAKTYPEMAGFHFRWWYESLLDPKDGHRQLEELTLSMMHAAKAVRPDMKFLMSGYFRMGGTKAFADRLPDGVILQSKWGSDWEPVPDPAVPMKRIAQFSQPFLISQCVPAEEFHSLGGVQYRSLTFGIDKYARASAAVTNLAGFALMVADADTEWITGLDFTVFARLNWNPDGPAASRLVDQYLLVHYGPRAGVLARQALELTQDAMEQYVVNFDGVVRYTECSRLHDMFGLSRVKKLTPEQLAKGLTAISGHAAKLAAARKLLDDGLAAVIPAGRESYRDLSIQTAFYAEFLRSRQLLAEAFTDLNAHRLEMMQRKLGEVKAIDHELIRLGLSKPNLSDDFEMDGMKSWVNLKPKIEAELKEIEALLTKVSALSTDVSKALWQIGKADGGNAEFALAPKDYAGFKDDGFFVVGCSDAKLDWPYVHPGPGDGWAGNCEHDFRIVFGLKDKPSAGTCRLRLDLLDTHGKAPPKLRIELNGTTFERALPAGGGDASVGGNLEQGKWQSVEIEFPSSLLKAGRNDIALINNSGSWFLYDAVTLEVPGAVLAPVAEAAALVAKARGRSVNVTDIWVVLKTHLDIGYTETIENVLTQYRVNMMDKALGVIEQDRQSAPEKRFVWTLAGWPLAHVLGPLQEPARKARIEQAVREGAITMHALPFTYHTETADLEDLVRGLGFSSKIARQYGRPLPVGAKMTDVPSHSWVWPTLLSNAGVRFLQLGCNDLSAYVHVPDLFWWEGPDGSRILCQYTRVYGSGLRPPRSWPSKNYLAMVMTYDNVGPPSAEDVEKLRQKAEKELPGVRVHLGTLDDFAKAVIAEAPELPVVHADMPDTWIHGWLSMPVEAKRAHNLRPLEPALEALDTQLRVWGVTPGDLAPALAEAYEQSLLFSEHTFGPDGPCWHSWKSGTPRYLYGKEWQAAYARGAYTKYEQAFDDKRAFARKAEEIVQRELAARLELLAKSVKADCDSVLVYNALPWKRSGLVDVPGRPGHCLYAEEVPANGYKVLPGKSELPVNAVLPIVLDTPFFKVTIDLKRGGIASLVEKKTGRECVDQTSEYALGQFLHERYDRQQMMAFHNAYGRGNYSWLKGGLPTNLVYAALTPPAWTAALTKGAAADVVTLTATDTLGLAKSFALVYTFPRKQPCVEVEWRVTEKTPDPLPEGGWLCFPLVVEEPRFLLGRLGGPIDPAKDIVPGANRHYFCISTGVTVSDKKGEGMGLCPIDSPCVSLGEPGLWKFSLDYVPKKPAVFVNLYNNEWMTNFPEWINGSWTSRVRLWPLSGEKEAESLAVQSWEARLPLLAVAADVKVGTLPSEQTGLELSRKGVLVTAFGANPDGAGTLLRMWEQSGVSGQVKVQLPKGMDVKTAQPVDLRGTTVGEKIKIKNGAFAVELKAFAPPSFVME
jgi:hypothetical protein